MNNYLIFCGLSFFSLFTLSFSETRVCGKIGIPTDWTAENSPYIITNDIIIPKGSRLKIAAGTIIRFTPPQPCSQPLLPQDDWADSQFTSIKVYGNFYINGTDEKPILFESHPQSKITGWDGIRFYERGHATTRITYAIFKGAHSAIRAFHSFFDVTHSLFENNQTGIFLTDYSNLTIVNNHFIHNKSSGIYIFGGSPQIYNNIFAFNQGYGIWSDNRLGTKIKYNGFWRNSEGHCHKCPVSILKFPKKDKDEKTQPTDKHHNLIGNPVFWGSKTFKILAKRDVSIDTKHQLTKNQALTKKVQSMEEELRSFQKRKSFVVQGKGAYRLSRYSAFINKGDPSKIYLDRDGTPNDLGIHGGTVKKVD